MSESTLTRADVTAAFRGAPHAMLEVGGARVASWRFGRGPDVVLVHGWPLHGATFRALVPLLADGLTVHVVDLPGAGRSVAAPGVRVDLRSQAATVRGVADALGLRAYGLLGHDSGGSIARMVAADDERARGVVVIDSEVPGEHTVMLRAFVAIGRVPGAGRALLAALRWQRVRRALFGGCFTDPAAIEGEFTDLFLRPLWTSRAAADGQLAPLLALRLADIDALAQVHARLRVPVLCVWGARDAFFPVAGARAMLPQLAGGGELVELPRARLFPHEDHAPDLAAAARPFLARCLGEARRAVS